MQCLILLVTSRAALTSADGSQGLVLSSWGLLLGSFLQSVHELNFLGVKLDLQTGASSLLRLDLRKAFHRLRALRVLDPGARDKFYLIRVFIFSMAFWSAGVSLPSKEQLRHVKTSMLLFLGHFTEDIASVVRAELLDRGAGPSFCSDHGGSRLGPRAFQRPARGQTCF